MKKYIFPIFTIVAVVGYLKFRPSLIEQETAPVNLPSLGTIGEFSLQSQQGESIGVQHLDGNVWIGSFIFTRCQGPCPMMTQKMARLQKELAGVPNLKHVSITMDPEHDTSEVLLEYANKYHADHDRWLFLTGNKQDIIKLAIEAFKLPAGEDPDMHSTRFVLVDQQQKIRGYYDSGDPESISKLSNDVKSLSQENKPNV
ncbi:MAG: SCO family protein [Oligoflexales bacterium]|nr:SCO family protein [Oligoflexales bacterium]